MNKSGNSSGGHIDGSALEELMNVIEDFNIKIQENTKKASKEKLLMEKATNDLKEMKDQLPLFITEKKGLCEQIKENYVKKMSI